MAKYRLLTKFLRVLERAGNNTLTLVPTNKLVKDVINDLKTVAASEEQKSERIVALISQVRGSIEADHEIFMDRFVANKGIYEL